MKNIAAFVCVFLSLSLYSQDPWDIFGYEFNLNFDDTSQFHRIDIDTISNPNNSWQIGSPQKNVFTSAYSLPNVIVTDTINPYPVNDTSSFSVRFLAGQGFTFPHTATVSGFYKVDSDSLSDFGKIEFSPDNGETWIDLLTDTVYENMGGYFFTTDRPVLTGVSADWEYFYVNIGQLGPILNIQEGDTVVYKFTFISDSTQTNRDGLMYDNLVFEDWVEGLDKIGYGRIKSDCFPNPVSELLSIAFDNNQSALFEVLIYDVRGRLLYTSTTTEDKIDLSVHSFNNGLYFYKLVNERAKEYTSGKFLKE